MLLALQARAIRGKPPRNHGRACTTTNPTTIPAAAGTAATSRRGLQGASGPPRAARTRRHVHCHRPRHNPDPNQRETSDHISARGARPTTSPTTAPAADRTTTSERLGLRRIWGPSKAARTRRHLHSHPPHVDSTPRCARKAAVEGLHHERPPAANTACPLHSERVAQPTIHPAANGAAIAPQGPEMARTGLPSSSAESAPHHAKRGACRQATTANAACPGKSERTAAPDAPKGRWQQPVGHGI